MPNPYDRLRFSQSQYIPQYHGAPVEEFGKLLDKREAAYQKNITDFDQIELAAANLDVNDADYTVKKQALDQIRGQVQSIADSGGAYEFASSQVRQMAKDFTGNQALKSAAQNNATIKARKDELQDLYNKKAISKVGFEHAKAKLDNYGGVGEGEDGIYNKPDIYDPVRFIDVGSELNKFGNGWRAETYSRGWEQRADGWYVKNTTQKIDEQEVAEAMRQHVEGSPEMMAVVNENAELSGGQDMLTPLIEAQMKKIGFTSYDSDTKLDSYALARAQAAAKDTDDAYNFRTATKTTLPGNQITDGADQIKLTNDVRAKRDNTESQLVIAKEQVKMNPGNPQYTLEVKALEDEAKRLEQEEMHLDRYDTEITRQAMTNLGFPPDSDYRLDEDIKNQAAERAETQIALTRPSFKDDPANFAIWLKNKEQNREEFYQKALNDLSPLEKERDRLYKENSKAIDYNINITGFNDKKEYDALQRHFDSMIPTLKSTATKSNVIGEEGAAGFPTGLQWVGRASAPVEAESLENLTELKPAGFAVNPTTGITQPIANLITDEEDQGLVFVGGPENDRLIKNQHPELAGELFGARLLAITNNLTGEGSLSDELLGDVKVKSYLKDKVGAAKIGGNYVITIDVKVDENSNETKEVSKAFSNKDEVKAYLQNIIMVGLAAKQTN